MQKDKLAKTDVPIHPLLAVRWSPRAFSDRPVTPDILKAIFEAARWAPSSFNEQPWRFLVATRENPAAYQRLLDCLMEPNRVWAKEAPALVLVVAKLTFSHNGKPNRHALHDVGLAVGNLTVQATSMDLILHQMAGFYVDKARETYGISDEYEPVSILVLGYHGDKETLPDSLAEKESAERVRKELSEIVFESDWNAGIE